MANRRSGLIPRKQLQARRLVEVRNDFNEITSITYTTFTINNCTVQPYVGVDTVAATDGFNTSSIYTIFTDTKLSAGKEGTSNKADEVMVNDSWCRVVKVKPWQNGLISHYEIVVIEKDEGLL